MVQASCHCLNIRVEVQEDISTLSPEDDATLQALRRTASESRARRRPDSKHNPVPAEVDTLVGGKLVAQDIVYSCLLFRNLISSPSETSPCTTQCLNCKDFVLVAAPGDRSIVLLNLKALVREQDAVKALESSHQYSPAFSLVLQQPGARDAHAADPTLSRISSEDPSRRPFDETTLPFEIRAALQDAIASLRQQADLLAAKARALQGHGAHGEDEEQEAHSSKGGRVQPPDEFGLPLQSTHRDSSSESLTGTSTPELPSSGSDDDGANTSRKDGRGRPSSEEQVDEEDVYGPAVLERLASPKRKSKARAAPGPSLLRRSASSGVGSSGHQAATGTPSSTSRHSSQRNSDSLSGPGGDNVASAEKRVKFADEGDIKTSSERRQEPAEGEAGSKQSASQARSLMTAELERQQGSSAAENGDEGTDDSGSEDPFPMDDDLTIPDEEPEKPATTHRAQDEQESKMFPATDAPSPSSLKPPQMMSPSTSSKWSRLAAQHADQVAKLRDLLGADAPSHREDDLRSLRAKRYGPSHHIGGKRRPIKSPAHELPEDPFEESDGEDGASSGQDDEDEDERSNHGADLARSLPINILQPNGFGNVKYDVKTSLPTHENLLVPHFERRRSTKAASSAAATEGSTEGPPTAGPSKTEERTISQQLRQATQSAVSASLSRSVADGGSSSKPQSSASPVPSPQAEATFQPGRRTHYDPPAAGPSSLSQSIPSEMLERLRAGKEINRPTVEEVQEEDEDQEEENRDVSQASAMDDMEFEGDEPKRFLPPHLWVRMSRSGAGMLSSSVRDLHLEE